MGWKGLGMRRFSRPLYLRLLGVRHLRPGPFALLLLLEGSFALALLLVLAGLVSAWALVAIPVAVAIMVKLNDAVARALVRPLALAQLRIPRPSEAPAVGRSPVPRPSYLTRYIDLDDEDSDQTRPPSDPTGPRRVARGVARVPTTQHQVGGPPPDRPDPRRDNRGRFDR
jgi:hypothetical protein